MEQRWFEKEDAFKRIMQIIYDIERDLMEIRDCTETYISALHPNYGRRIFKNSDYYLSRVFAKFITREEEYDYENVNEFLERIEYTKSDSSIIAERLLSAKELVKEVRDVLKKYGFTLHSDEAPAIGLSSSLYDSATDRVFYHRAALE